MEEVQTPQKEKDKDSENKEVEHQEDEEVVVMPQQKVSETGNSAKLMAEGKITVMSPHKVPISKKRTKGLKLSLNTEQREENIDEQVIITPNLMNLNGLTQRNLNRQNRNGLNSQQQRQRVSLGPNMSQQNSGAMHSGVGNMMSPNMHMMS